MGLHVAGAFCACQYVSVSLLMSLFHSLSDPLFEEVIAVVTDGFIHISLSFVHTDGLDIIHIQSVCNVDGACGSGNSLITTLCCDEMNLCNDENLTRGMVLGPLQTNVVYTCTVTAFNGYGFDVERKGNITSNIGQSKIVYLHCSL